MVGPGMGRIQLMVFKKFLIPTFGAAVIKHASDDSEANDSLCRPSELPIYGEVCEICTPDPCDDQSALECQIGVLRKELWVWHDKYKGARKEIIEVCETGLAHTASMLDYLKEENNYMPRYGAIGISGLAGVVLGLRGGVIRRVTYGTTAALAMASVCYPREAREITRESLYTAKKYFRIGYNFIYGDDGTSSYTASILVAASHTDEVSIGAAIKGYAEEREQQEAREREVQARGDAATAAAEAAAAVPCPVRNPKHEQMQVRFACLKDPLVRQLPPERPVAET